MKLKFLLPALILAATTVACNEDPFDESGNQGVIPTRSVTTDINSSVGSRIAITGSDYDSSTNSYASWGFTWDDGDALWGWGSSYSTYKFEMANYDSAKSTFTGKMDYYSDKMRFIYPYDENLTISNGAATFDLSEQSIDLTKGDYNYVTEAALSSFSRNNMYLMSNEFEIADENPTVNMQHIFTYLQVSISAPTITNEELILTKVEIDGLTKNSATISYDHVSGSEITEDEGYALSSVNTFTYGEDTDFTVSVANAVKLYAAETSIIPIQVTPFILGDCTLTIKLTFDNAQTVTITKEITGDTTKAYLAGEFNDIDAEFSVADLVTNLPELNDNEYYLSEFSANTAEETTFIPEGSEWTIYVNDYKDYGSAYANGSELSYQDFTGLERAIAAANTSSITPNIIFADLTAVPESALNNQDTSGSDTPTNNPDIYNFCNATMEYSLEFPVATSIGFRAFWGNQKLSAIDLTMVESIGGDAFRNCYAITKLNLDTVTSFGAGSVNGGVFRGTSSIKKVDLPLLTEVTGSYNFGGATALTTLNLPKVSSLDNMYSYYNVNLTSFTLGTETTGVTTISKYLFRDGASGTDNSPTAATLIINPAAEADRNYTFDTEADETTGTYTLTLYADSTKGDSDSAPTSVEFALITTDLDYVVPVTYTLSDFSADMDLPEAQEWVITEKTAATVVPGTTDVYAGLRDAITAAQGIYTDGEEHQNPIINFLNMTTISNYAFCSVNLTSNGVTTYYDTDFAGNEYEVILSSATVVGQSAFHGSSLTKVTAELVTELKYGAFHSTTITEIDLPALNKISGNLALAATTTMTSVKLGSIAGGGLETTTKNPFSTTEDHEMKETTLEIVCASATEVLSIDTDKAVIYWDKDNTVFNTTFKSITATMLPTLLENFSATSYPIGDAWEITDSEVDDADDFAGLKLAILAANALDVIPTITFTNLKTVPFESFDDFTGSFSVVLSAATYVGDSAFLDCTGLASVSLPVIESIYNSHIFVGSGITSLTLGSEEVGIEYISDETFTSDCYGATSLTIYVAADSTTIEYSSGNTITFNGAEVTFGSITYVELE